MNVVILISLVAAVVTILGGFAAVAYTDTIQTVIMILGCTLMLFLGLDKVGGWDELMIKAGSQMHVAGPIDDPSYPFWGIIVGVVYGGLFYWGMDQVNVQRVLGARDLQHARWGAMFAGLLKLTPIFIFALPGVITFCAIPGAFRSGFQEHLCSDAQQSPSEWDSWVGVVCIVGSSHFINSGGNEFGFDDAGP